MRTILAALLLCATGTSVNAQSPSSFQLHGFVTARGVYVGAQPSWTTGGFGRFDVGAATADDHRTVNVDIAQIGADWTPSTWFLVHADGIARREPSGTGGKRAGVLQAFADLYTDRWRFRAGSFWLGTSRENIGPLWTSPYTITYSALNSWIGQEFRPIGADLQYSPNFYLTVGATAFEGSDTLGTLLAGHGFTFGNRLTVYEEDVPLPNSDRTTQPMRSDLDHRIGYSGRIRLQLPERALLQVTHIDNRSRLEVARPAPWQTRFDVIGATAGTTSPVTLTGEWARGWTSVAHPGGIFRLDFNTGYVLLSQKKGAERWTVRVDRFTTRNHTRPLYDDSAETGHAVTVAWFHDSGPHMRSGIEYARVSGERLGIEDEGFNPMTGGSTYSIELRYSF